MQRKYVSNKYVKLKHWPFEVGYDEDDYNICKRN
jgi:hypothetical protein